MENLLAIKYNEQVRLAGGGRKSVEDMYPDILSYVQAILDEATYGSPESGRRWTNLSQQDIADELKSRHGICISANTAGRLIEKLGYSKQANKEMNQVGEPHPDRDAQFQFLDGQTQEFLDAGDPVIPKFPERLPCEGEKSSSILMDSELRGKISLV